MHFFSSVYFLPGLVVGVRNPWVIDSLTVMRPHGWCPVTAGGGDRYLRERGSTEPWKQISCGDPREQSGSPGNAAFLGQKDLPLEETFTWGGCTLQGHLSCLTQRTENRLPDIVTEVRGRAALPAYVVIYFFSLLPCVAQREWDMFDSILIIFFSIF